MFNFYKKFLRKSWAILHAFLSKPKHFSKDILIMQSYRPRQGCITKELWLKLIKHMKLHLTGLEFESMFATKVEKCCLLNH